MTELTDGRQASVTLIAHRILFDGYGYAAIQIGDAMQRLDPNAAVVDMSGDGEHFATREHNWLISGTAVALCTPDWLPYIQADRLINYTMFEATRLPAGWADLINAHAAMCLVPSAWCAEVFRDNGVTVPVEVARFGINPLDYWPIHRAITPDRPYTFLWSGTADMRKGWDVAYLAFIRAFARSKRAQLHLRFRDELPGRPRFGDANVRVTVGRFDLPQMRAMLEEADCFVCPSRGEGWGLPPREAAATGLPVIATNYGGLAEEITCWALPLNVRGTSPAGYGWWPQGTIGEWAEPDVDDLANWMTTCATNREQAAGFGEGAALWLARHATWKRTAQRLLTLAGEEVRR